MKKIITAVLVLSLLMSAGCDMQLFGRSHFVYQRVPVIPLPDRPDLSKPDLSKLDKENALIINNNTNKLMSYSKQLEIAIKMYNNFAAESNTQGGYVISEIE